MTQEPCKHQWQHSYQINMISLMWVCVRPNCKNTVTLEAMRDRFKK